MRLPTAVAISLVVLAAIAFATWRGELWSVPARGSGLRALTPLPDSARAPVRLDVVLPTVPTGMRRLRDHAGALLVHYWAPWEQGSRAQAHALDSLAHTPELARMTIVLVCFDAFPSVARYVGRERLRLPVMLDGEHRLARVLPCPSIPTTYVIDGNGTLRVRQEGAIDWLDRSTRATLDEVLGLSGAADTLPAVPTPPRSVT